MMKVQYSEEKIMIDTYPEAAERIIEGTARSMGIVVQR